jgi:uncharacterized membrane protein
LPSVILDKWTWIVILSIVLVLVVPLIVVWAVLQMASEFRVVATISIIVLWGVVSGYKDWVIAKRKEEENASPQA